MLLPRLVITDIDGVWTDAGMYYSEKGDELKKFNTRDSAGVTFLRELDIPLAIMSGEKTSILERRAQKLGIEHLHQGVKNKLSLARQLCEKLEIELSECAFIGDDLNDLKLLQNVGFSACPADAPQYIKSEVDLILQNKGGGGAFREFIEHILTECGKLEFCIDAFVNRLDKK